LTAEFVVGYKLFLKESFSTGGAWMGTMFFWLRSLAVVYAQSPGQQETDEKFGRVWFASLARFHKVRNSHSWDFNQDHVIAFLRFKLSEKMPTWKRLKIVQGLIWYRNNVRKSSQPEMENIRAILREKIASEREQAAEAPRPEAVIEDVVGKIDPKLPDAIQAMKRIMRLKGNSYNTEKAYVGKLEAFMKDFGLKTLADFNDIGAEEVEAHLTDLAVDGDVAPSICDFGGASPIVAFA